MCASGKAQHVFSHGATRAPDFRSPVLTSHLLQEAHVQLFGVKTPVAAFIADSLMLLVWSVSARICSWKNSD